MKKVAIVTPEALTTRSFLWDELSERFKVKLNNVDGNPITQQEDGLYILGEEGNNSDNSNNELGRYVFTNGVVELSHLSLEITTSSEAPLVLIPKVDMLEASFQRLNNGELFITRKYRISSGRAFTLEIGTSCRIAYMYDDRVVVMDVFLARVEGKTQYGFVDVLINARGADFPTPQEDEIIVRPAPVIAT